MKDIFDKYSREASKEVTRSYSTSFYAGVNRLGENIRDDIHAIYGFVRFADEIVDSFHEFPKEELLFEFEADTKKAIQRGISLNPILNSFQHTVNKYNIDLALIDQFLDSMKMDLSPVEYQQENYDSYILGSAEVVGLMCLKVFVEGNEDLYLELKPYSMKLGSAFQKINFLRDLNQDYHELGRSYFPNVDIENMSIADKLLIEKEIEEEFKEALVGIKKLPKSSRAGVFISYKYYLSLLDKIKRKTTQELLDSRIRVPDSTKFMIFIKSMARIKLNRL